MLQPDSTYDNGPSGLPRALGYIRVSTDRQERSPAAQERIITAVADPFGPLLLYRDIESALEEAPRHARAAGAS